MGKEAAKYEQAVFAWAEKRLNLPKGSVARVDFGTEDEGYCDTCSYTVGGVEVVTTTGKDKKGRSTGVKYHFISLGGDSFSSVLSEIIEAGGE